MVFYTKEPRQFINFIGLAKLVKISDAKHRGYHNRWIITLVWLQ